MSFFNKRHTFRKTEQTTQFPSCTHQSIIYLSLLCWYKPSGYPSTHSTAVKLFQVTNDQDGHLT